MEVVEIESTQRTYGIEPYDGYTDQQVFDLLTSGEAKKLINPTDFTSQIYILSSMTPIAKCYIAKKYVERLPTRYAIAEYSNKEVENGEA